MTTIDPQTAEKMRQSFKQLNKFVLLMWRLGLGRWMNIWPEKMGQVMVVTHTGRKSGLTHHTPVNYAIVEGDVYCAAGFGKGTDWYKNVLADPSVEVWLPDGWWAGTAEEIEPDDENFLPVMRQVLIGSGFAAPMLANIYPDAMTDDEIRAATKGYRLIRIRRTEARTGPGGPGELSWVWPVAAMVLLPMVLRRKRRKR